METVLDADSVSAGNVETVVVEDDGMVETVVEDVVDPAVETVVDVDSVSTTGTVETVVEDAVDAVVETDVDDAVDWV